MGDASSVSSSKGTGAHKYGLGYEGKDGRSIRTSHTSTEEREMGVVGGIM